LGEIINTKNVIFDFGANIGLNIPYYLLKAHRVVAVEGNPSAARIILEKFPDSSLVTVENYVVSNFGSDKLIPFYINEKKSFLSSMTPLKEAELAIKHLLPSKTVTEIIKKNLNNDHLFFVKFDLEGADYDAISNMFAGGYFPTILTSEIYNIHVIDLIFSSNKYNAFKIVNGQNISKDYKKSKIITENRKKKYKFLSHSSGPFGDDLHGPYLTKNEVQAYLKEVNTSWLDICATYL